MTAVCVCVCVSERERHMCVNVSVFVAVCVLCRLFSMPATADHLLAGAETQQAPGPEPAPAERLWSAAHTHTHTHRLGTRLSVPLGNVTVTVKMIQDDVSIHCPSVLLTQRQRSIEWP